jgi:hypothetical protein
VLTGCATYTDTIGKTERDLARHQPRAALAEYEKRSSGGADRVLDLMNEGMMLRMAGDFDKSTVALEDAKTLIGELQAVSIREQALSVAVNDSTKSFIGEDFEQVMVHTYLALNYLEQRQLDAARVEALQVDLLLKEKAERNPNSPYVEDAFARYLTGIIYEDEGEWSDAMIAYRKAYEAYHKQQDRFGVAIPETLKYDLIRLADREGLNDEAGLYRTTFNIGTVPSTQDMLERGEIILTVHAGLAPIKREKAITMLNPKTGRFLRLALPEYQLRGQPFAYAKVSAESLSATTSRVENIDAIAMRSLQAEMPTITARAFARMALKDTAAAVVGSSGGRGHNNNAAAGALLAELALNVAATLSERADTRSWFTLPGEIHLARLSLPPGEYNVRIELYGRDHGVLDSRELHVSLHKGEKKYVSEHWIPVNLESRP